MNKSGNAIVLLSIFILLYTASCNPNRDPVRTIRVAMLAEGNTFDDKAFLQSCKTGMEQAKTDFGIECEYNISTNTNDYPERVEYFGDRNFDLIIGIGYMWNDAIVAAAKKHPQTHFVLVDAELSESQSNAVSILFDVDEATYPLGFLSAWWADSHDPENPAVGFVGALKIPQIRQLIEPYLNGVDEYNRKYQRNVTYFGDYAGTFFDSLLGGHLADSIINLGADVMFGVGSETGNSALSKAKEFGKCGIGVDVDQYISFPQVADILISSAMKGLDHSIYAVVKSFLEDSFTGGGVYTGNLANDGVALAPYHDFEARIPDSVKIQIKAIQTGIMNGSISTGW